MSAGFDMRPYYCGSRSDGLPDRQYRLALPAVRMGWRKNRKNSPGCHAPGFRRTTPFSRYCPPARRPKAQVCDEFHLQYSAIWLGGPQSLVHYGRAGLDIIRPSTHLVKR